MDECGRRLSSNDLTSAVQFANYLQQLAPGCVDTFQCVGIIAYTNGDLLSAIIAFERVRRAANSTLHIAHSMTLVWTLFCRPMC